MRLIKCDWCKKIMENRKENIYDLEIRNAKLTVFESFDICKDCFKELCEKLSNTEENEDGNTES